MSKGKFSPLSLQIRAELFTQLGQMETAGLPFMKAMAVLQLARAAKPRLDTMKTLAARGMEPAKAGERSGLFTTLEARLIHAASSAGSPAGMYRRLGTFYTQRAMQVATMKSRLLMPALVLLLALCIQPLPLLIGGSIGVGGYAWQVVRPLMMLAVLFYGGRGLWQFLLNQAATSAAGSGLLRLPLLGALVVRCNLRDFFESLALMLEAGVSILDALPAALDTLEVAAIRRELAQIAPRIARGDTFAASLKGLSYIGANNNGERLLQFVNTGEQSGTLPEMMLRHTMQETEGINLVYTELAAWVPRILYGLVACWMAYGLLKGGGVVPQLPSNL